MKRFWVAALCAVLLTSMVGFSNSASAGYALGDRGQKVLEIKKRMRDLGYFVGKKLSDTYNANMVEKVKEFQTMNGLKSTGTLDDQTIEMLYSDNVRSSFSAPLITEENQNCFIFPDMDKIDLSVLEEPQYPVIIQSREAGYWLYETESIRIEIKRIEWPEKPLVWFETDIRLSQGETFHRLDNRNAKGKLADEDPRKIAKNNKAVLAISDDYASFRIDRGRKTGIVIHNGEIIGKNTYRATSVAVPNLDILALFPDGSMKTFESNQYKPEEYLEMGVTDTFAFGPYLLRDGEVNPDFSRGDTGYNKYEPRNALGMIEPGHYLFVTTLGRQTKSAGTYLVWLAYRMKDLGCVEALNLDGGNSIAIVFMGDLINKAENIDKVSFMTGVRKISSLLGVGTYDEK